MTRRHRGLGLTPDEASELAALLDTMRAELGDAAQSTLAELTALVDLWDEVVSLFPGRGAAGRQTTSREPRHPPHQPHRPPVFWTQ
jgi:hypothetical protein